MVARLRKPIVMTKHDFITQHKMAMSAQERHSRRVVVYGLGGAFVAGMPLAYFVDWQGYLDQLVGTSLPLYWLEGVGGILLIGYAFALCRVTQPYGVPCPNCGKRLIRIGGLLALMTGNCGFCGEKVVDDCDGDPSAAGRILHD